MLTCVRLYIEVNFTFALVDCVCYNEDSVKSRFCSIHFTEILAGMRKIVCYTEDSVKSRFYSIRLTEILDGLKNFV